MATTSRSKRLSTFAETLLAILYWEKDRPEAVTVTEVRERLGVPQGQVKAAFGELYDKGFVDARFNTSLAANITREA